MWLSVAATEMEMQPFKRALRSDDEVSCLVSGVGPVEAALAVARSLAKFSGKISGVLNFGVAGAYTGTGGGLLDICLAESEVLGDLGISFGSRVEPLNLPDGSGHHVEHLDSTLLESAANLLSTQRISFLSGNFVTVCGASGTAARGDLLRRKFDAVCENMEGAAVARVCRDFDVPFLELRCVSNLVEDRNLKAWKLDEACARAGEVAALVVAGLQDSEIGGV